MQAVIGTESGASHQIELEDEQVRALTGLKIGDEVDGAVLGLRGYTLRITGGSDTEGFPMRARVEGTGRRKLLLEGGMGAKNLEDGERKRKSVRGNTVSGQLSQVNLAVEDEGDEAIDTLLGTDTAEDSGADDEPAPATDVDDKEQEDPDGDEAGEEEPADEDDEEASEEQEDSDEDEEEDATDEETEESDGDDEEEDEETAEDGEEEQK